jgi:hypothetical protein
MSGNHVTAISNKIATNHCAEVRLQDLSLRSEQVDLWLALRTHQCKQYWIKNWEFPFCEQIQSTKYERILYNSLYNNQPLGGGDLISLPFSLRYDCREKNKHNNQLPGGGRRRGLTRICCLNDVLGKQNIDNKQ